MLTKKLSYSKNNSRNSEDSFRTDIETTCLSEKKNGLRINLRIFITHKCKAPRDRTI